MSLAIIVILSSSIVSGFTIILTSRPAWIAKRIEEEMDYPGQIKVNVIRETRAIEYAK